MHRHGASATANRGGAMGGLPVDPAGAGLFEGDRPVAQPPMREAARAPRISTSSTCQAIRHVAQSVFHSNDRSTSSLPEIGADFADSWLKWVNVEPMLVELSRVRANVDRLQRKFGRHLVVNAGRPGPESPTQAKSAIDSGPNKPAGPHVSESWARLARIRPDSQPSRCTRCPPVAEGAHRYAPAHAPLRSSRSPEFVRLCLARAPVGSGGAQLGKTAKNATKWPATRCTTGQLAPALHNALLNEHSKIIIVPPSFSRSLIKLGRAPNWGQICSSPGQCWFGSNVPEVPIRPMPALFRPNSTLIRPKVNCAMPPGLARVVLARNSPNGSPGETIAASTSTWRTAGTCCGRSRSA